MKGIIKKVFRLSSLGLLSLLATQAFAAGYRLEFQSASVLADEGDAAVVEDASTNWYNSAGLVYLPQQLVFAGFDVYSPTTFTGTMTAPANPLFPPAFGFSAYGSASSHSNNLLPAFHYSLPLSPRIAVGFTMTPAWGLAEDFGRSSLVRYDLSRIYTKTIDLSPSVAVKLTDHWSIGLGPDFHYFSVLQRYNVRTQGPLAFGGTPGDSQSRFSASAWNYGGHIGILYSITQGLRIGLNYRSKITSSLSGWSVFSLNSGPQFQTNKFKLSVPLPPSTALSVYSDIGYHWAVMGTLNYDQWSVVRRYLGQNYIQPPTPGNPTGILPNVPVIQNMHDTLQFGAGMHYRINDRWLIRGSIKYIPTPTSDAFRDVNFPDADKLGFELGAHWQLTRQIGFDGILGHVFLRTEPINNTNPITLSTLTGHSNTGISFIGGQLDWSLCC